MDLRNFFLLIIHSKKTFISSINYYVTKSASQIKSKETYFVFPANLPNIDKR